MIRPSHRRRLKRCVVSNKMKDQDGVWKHSFAVPSKRDEQKPALTQEQMGMKLYSLGLCGSRERMPMGECQGSGGAVASCMKRAEIV